MSLMLIKLEKAAVFHSHNAYSINKNEFFFLIHFFYSSYDDEEDYESNIDILESHMDDQVACDINEL